MIEINIPGYKCVKLRYLLLDYNGTIAKDGKIEDRVRDKIKLLSRDIEILVLTADTHNNAAKELEGLPVKLIKFQKGLAAKEKKDIVSSLSRENCIAFGNGRNDEKMLEESEIKVAVLGEEGCSSKALLASDIVVRDICDAFDLLINPLRLIATLRG